MDVDDIFTLRIRVHSPDLEDGHGDMGRQEVLTATAGAGLPGGGPIFGLLILLGCTTMLIGLLTKDPPTLSASLALLLTGCIGYSMSSR
jgi:hypothetical protein